MKLIITSNIEGCMLLVTDAKKMITDENGKILEFAYKGFVEEYPNHIKKCRKVLIRMRHSGYIPYEKEHWVNEAIHIKMKEDKVV